MDDEVKIESTVLPVDPIISVADHIPPVTPKPKRKYTRKAKKAPVKRAVKAKGKRKAKKAKSLRAPRTRDVSTLDVFGFRKGSMRSDAAMMYRAGATLDEVKGVLGSIQYNVLTALAAKGFNVTEKVIKNDNKRKVIRYKVSSRKG